MKASKINLRPYTFGQVVDGSFPIVERQNKCIIGKISFEAYFPYPIETDRLNMIRDGIGDKAREMRS